MCPKCLKPKSVVYLRVHIKQWMDMAMGLPQTALIVAGNGAGCLPVSLSVRRVDGL